MISRQINPVFVLLLNLVTYNVLFASVPNSITPVFHGNKVAF